MAHVALADHAALGVVLRHAVGTGPRAVLASNAGVRAVQHDPGHGILRVGIDGTALQAGGLDAVIAPHRQVRARGLGIPAPFDFGDTPPVDRRRISVLLVARDDAALAPDAQAHVDVESVPARPGASARTGRRGAFAPDSAERTPASPRVRTNVTPSSVARSRSGSVMSGGAANRCRRGRVSPPGESATGVPRGRAATPACISQSRQHLGHELARSPGRRKPPQMSVEIWKDRQKRLSLRDARRRGRGGSCTRPGRVANVATSIVDRAAQSDRNVALAGAGAEQRYV